MAARGLIQDPFDVIGETHFQHFVGFIEHQALEGVEHQGASPHVVHDATGGTDDDLGTAVQLPELDLVVLSAIDAGDRNAPHLGGVLRVGVGDLNRKFPCGGEDQNLNRRDFGIEAMEGGEGKRSGFSGTGLCLPQHIASFDQMGNRLGLNRRRLRVASCLDSSHNTRIEPEVIEGIARRDGLGSDRWFNFGYGGFANLQCFRLCLLGQIFLRYRHRIQLDRFGFF